MQAMRSPATGADLLALNHARAFGNDDELMMRPPPARLLQGVFPCLSARPKIFFQFESADIAKIVMQSTRAGESDFDHAFSDRRQRALAVQIVEQALGLPCALGGLCGGGGLCNAPCGHAP